ncbi:AAA family ATPase [[Actinomadura] parvosata]|uniref:AAA family ATPase n=1 Tax=[Actinomadura] parvosata TaxID=1955412 RepID=UPI00406CBE2F
MPNLGESLLPVAAVFGPNASGRSNVIAAVTWLRMAVRESLRMWDDEIPVEPFPFSAGQGRPSAFTLEAVISGVRYEYVVELDRPAIRRACRVRFADYLLAAQTLGLPTRHPRGPQYRTARSTMRWFERGPGGAALLDCHSLFVPETAARVHEVFEDLLDTPGGRVELLSAAAHILGRAHRMNDFEELQHPVPTLAHRLLESMERR